ncbi:MAG: ATP-binding protein [Bacteroidia bacterium]|nr:ATP-binding protein [Bacteroidia bacterium]
MGKTIIVFGLPGSGKSLFAEALATRLSATYLSSDQIRLSFSQENRYGESAKRAIYEAMKTRTMDARNKGETVVADATFFRQDLREYFIRDLPGRVFFLEIYADESVIRSRLKTKRRFSEADFEVFQKIKSAFEPLKEPHLSLDSGSLTIEEMLREAESYLKDNHHESGPNISVDRREYIS